MDYYINTQFLEGSQDKRIFGIKYGETKPIVDLISIGIVAEDGREYYAISNDFNIRDAWDKLQSNSVGLSEYWIRENVLFKVFIDLICIERGWNKKDLSMSFFVEVFNAITRYDFEHLVLTNAKTNIEIAGELEEFFKNDTSINFYGYYSAYSWVCLCQLFGDMMSLPIGFPYFCNDIKQLAYLKEKSTNEILLIPSKKDPNNALSEAKWNKMLHLLIEKSY